MSDYLNDLMEKARKFADKAAAKTQETVEAAKLEIELRKAQSALDKEYKALGQIEFHIENGSMNRDETVIQAACQKIQEAIDKISALQEKKDAPKQAPAEEAPAEEEPEEEPAAEEAEEEAEEEEEPSPVRNEDGYFMLKFCPNCKVGNHPDAKKCVNCGTPFADAEEEAEGPVPTDTTAESQSEAE